MTVNEFVKTLSFDERVEIMKGYDRLENSDNDVISSKNRKIVQRYMEKSGISEEEYDDEVWNVTIPIYYIYEMNRAICHDFAWKYVQEIDG